MAQGNFDYSEEERRKWREDPESYHDYRRKIEDGIMAYMAEDGFKYGSDIQTTMENDSDCLLQPDADAAPKLRGGNFDLAIGGAPAVIRST